MGFISSFLGGSTDPLPALRKMTQRHAWSEVHARITDIDRSRLTVEQLGELDQLVIQSGDGLAKLNLLEGDALAGNDEKSSAREHYLLALNYARTQELCETLQERLRGLDTSLPSQPISKGHVGCGSGHCNSTKGSLRAVNTSEELGVDERLELIAAASPPEVAQRYRQLTGAHLEAVLLAHEDRFDEAMTVFSDVHRDDQGELFYFERGSLLARHGHYAEAFSDLRECVTRFEFLPALEGLIDLSFFCEDVAGAEALLLSTTAHKLPRSIFHARMAILFQARGDSETALSHALIALQSGCRDPDIVLLAASLYENQNNLDAAEALFASIGGGGCSGGGNPYLAEFLFRHDRNLPVALEGFKAVARSEPDNLYWWLRIGQTYLRLGWVKDAKPLLKQVAAASSASDQLRATALDELARL